MEFVANKSLAVAHETSASERVYKLTEKQLWNIMCSVFKNISLLAESEGRSTSTSQQPMSFGSPHINPNVTSNITTLSENLSVDDRMMVYYVLVFFIWYGALIFGCLIGAGVYKTPGSFHTYKRFVDREDLRNKLKEQKLAEIERKRTQRQNSIQSTICASPSSASELSVSCNGGGLHMNAHGRLIIESPRSVLVASTIYQEEEEALLEDQLTTSPKSKMPDTNEFIVFDI